MIPAREDIPEEEQLGWITARLADPYFDWRTPLAHPRPGRRGSGAPATPPASDVGEVLDIWQRINGSEFGERRARFLVSPALGDLVQFPADVLWERGRRPYQAHGRLLLNDWAAECAVPGLTDLPDAGDLRKVLARTGESVRRLVAAAVAAVPDEGDRGVLERRLGLSGGAPQTLAQIGAHLGISRERVRQRADRAVKAIASRRARTGYRTARAKARAWVSELISGDDGHLGPELRHGNRRTQLPRGAAREFRTGDYAHRRRVGRGAAGTGEDAENLCRLGIGPTERGRAFGMRRAGLGPCGGRMIFGLWA